MHEVDLRLWIANHPDGALAAARGTTYRQAWTTAPSDSFPRMILTILVKQAPLPLGKLARP
jgi:hypothetical protein